MKISSKKDLLKLNFQSFLQKINQLISTKPLIFFILILLIGLYLRFYLIEETLYFGYDQGRDAWIVKDIIDGKLSLIGPRTGVGNFHLGPIYYYLLAPFYKITDLDPMAANYFSIAVNIFNFSVLFYVTKKIFNNYAALFVVMIYATSEYLMGSRIPWNVSLMPSISTLIFYSIIKVYEGSYRWILAMWALSGFYFNINFTAIFFPPIIIASLVFVKDKKKALKYSLVGIPLYLVWFVPNIIYEFQNSGVQYLKIKEFLNNYYIGFHLRFMIYRFSNAFIQFETIANFPRIIFLKFIIPFTFFIIAFILSRNKKDKILAYLISLWFIIPLLGFTLYGGPISDYYFLFQVPIVLFIFWYLIEKLLKLKHNIIFVLVIFILSFYIYYNTNGLWVKKPTGLSLKQQKEEVKNLILKGEKLDNKSDPYFRDKIEPYLYTIWVENGKRW